MLTDLTAIPLKSKENELIVVDLFYLPPIEFFVAILGYDTLLIEKHENYRKQSYRNRSGIQLANKTEYLSVPVKGGNKKIKYKDIEIDHSQRWMNIHLRGIQSAYGNAPFFEYFYPEFEKVYQKKHDRLYDLNMELLTLCLYFLGCKIGIKETTEYREYENTMDLRTVINAKTSFEHRNIYNAAPYVQIFGVDFVPNLSVIDLLFCEGPDSKKIIGNSVKKKLNNT